MEYYIIAFVLIVLVVGLLLSMVTRSSKETVVTTKAPTMKKGMKSIDKIKSVCPLCKSGLKSGERVRSVIFSKDKDKMMHIYGCPYCYPANSRKQRICPVCKKKLPDNGYLIARVFEKPEKRHVHVLGCSECRWKK